MLESEIEKRFNAALENGGAMSLKLRCAHLAGFPDRTVLYKGKVYFVELKTTRGKLSPIQRIVQMRMERYGFTVYNVYGLEQAQKLVKFILSHKK